MEGEGSRRPSGVPVTPLSTTGDDLRGQTIDPKEEMPFDFNVIMDVDLSSIDKSVLKQPHTKLPILKAHNYFVWAQVHKEFLDGRGLFGIVAGTHLPSTQEEAKNWRIYDSWIASLLTGCVEETQLPHITHLPRSKAKWDELRRVHGISGKGRILSMLQRLHGYQKGADESIDQMVATLRQLINEITNILPIARPPPIIEAIILMNACQGDEYAMAKYTLGKTDSDLLTPSLAVEHLRTVEEEIKSKKDTANVAKGGKSGRPGAGQRGRSSDYQSKVRCYGCGEEGHIRKDCPTNPWDNDEKDDSSRPKFERKKSSKTGNDASKPSGRKKDKAAAAADNDDDEEPSKERAWMATFHHSQAPGWLIDSGATRHMTPLRNLFVRFSHCGGEVEFGNQGELPVAGRGDIEIMMGGRSQKLKDVLYVPKMSANLLSIMALDRKGYSVTFGGQRVEIVNQRSNQIVARGHAVKGLYELTDSESDRAFASQEAEESSDYEEPPIDGTLPDRRGEEAVPPTVTGVERLDDKAPVQDEVLPQREFFELMHRRLGHPGTHRMKNLHQHASGVKAFEVPDEFQCDVCDQAKMIQTINREPRPRVKVPGARMHSDIWGPFPCGSLIGGCKSYVSLIDEDSARARMNIITSKGEVRLFIIHEVRWITYEGHKPVIVVHVDNAKEYQAAEKELWSMGVSIEFVSTYTAHQNGIAERFNRTVITIARCMLIESGLSLSFWAEAVLYACHLYNKMPQETRGGKSPDEIWFKVKPTLTNERVFGCICRVLLAKEQRQNKLTAVTYLGVYTGYHSSTQYRVYWPEKNRFEWPTNVKFYEDRKGVDLLPQGLLPKFDSVRAEASPLQPIGVAPPSDDRGVLMEYESSDDGGQEDDRPPGGPVTSPPANETNEVLENSAENSGPEGVSPPVPSSFGENDEISGSLQQNEATSSNAIGTSQFEAENFEQNSQNRSPRVSATPTPLPRPRAFNRKPVVPTAASSRPVRERRPAGRQEFLENFGKENVHVAQQKIEPQTY